MGWTDIVDQRRVVEALRNALARGRVAHAYLFHGPDGVGKRATALAFARALQCETGTVDGCGACTACSKVRRLIHPDVHVYMPLHRDVEPEDVGERLALLASSPYSIIDFVRRPSLSDPSKTSNKQVFYSVERINKELRAEMSLKPNEGRYKIALITDADLMNEEAANSLLKLLEEPPPFTVLILTTQRPDRLLPTVVSRCQSLRFEPLSYEDIEQALVAGGDIDPENAAMLARMADGSYGRALELAESSELVSSRSLVVDYLRLVYVQHQKGDQLVDMVGRLSEMSREQLKSVLGLLLIWIRDLVLQQTLGAEAPLVNIDQKEAVARFCANLPKADLEAMSRAVEEAVFLLGRNVNQHLLLVVLSNVLMEAMQGLSEGNVYRPLSEARTEAWS